MARGGGGREEESLGALLSPPPGGGARAALACLTRPRPARPLFTRQAGPGRPGLGAPPPPGPTKWLGGGEEEAMGVFSRLLGGGRSAGPRRLGLLLLFSFTPPPAPLYLRGPRQEAVRGPGPATTVSYKPCWEGG